MKCYASGLCLSYSYYKHAHRNFARTLLFGGVRRTLLEFIWSVSYSIVADHYWGRMARIAVKNTINKLDSLVFCTYYMAQHGWALRKIFKNKALRWVQNAMLKLDFVNSVFHKRAILEVFEEKFTEIVLGILSYSTSTIRFTMVEPKEKLSK